MEMRRSISLTVVVLVGGLLLSSCARDSGSENGEFHVTSEVVSHGATKDMLVFAPDAEGPWPVIVAFHGVGGTPEDMAEIATRLAREGNLVFAPTYATDITTQEGVDRAAVDAECGYRFARSLAAEYGGDLDQPVTFVGWSLGASAALAIGLTEEIDPTGEFVSCFGQVPRPDIIVAISGCHYEGGQLDFVDTAAWGNKEADVFLLAGEKDTNCPPWETEDAAAEMRSAGYEVDLSVLDGADHFAPVFHDLQDGEFVVVANDPAGERTVEVILDAIAARQHRT
jgi:dienelactone hydrolase